MAPSPERKRYLLGALIAALLHLLAFEVLRQGFAYTPPGLEPEDLVTVFIQPRIREADEPHVERARPLDLVRFRMEDLQLPEPDIDVSVDRNTAASSVAPTLIQSSRLAMGPYVKAAGLLPGEGATTVLRIEVLATGQAGDIAIDVSSGSRQVDHAAIEYARSQRWYAGRQNGSPHAQWIRWGVRLQA